MSDKAVLLSVAAILLIAGPPAEPQHQERGAACAPAPGMDILGHGYDVFGEYASQSSLKPYDLFVWRNFREEGEPPGCYRTPEFFHITRLGRTDKHDGSQSWILRRAEGTTYTIEQQRTGRFLDAWDNSKRDYRAVTRPPQNDRSQHWILTHVKEDTYTIRQDLGRRFLDAYTYTNRRHDYDAVTRGQQNDESQLWRLTRMR